MTDFLLRQFNILLQAIRDYQKDKLDLHHLIGVLEGLANIIDDDVWSKKIFEVAWDLELINSELIDKKRCASPVEKNTIQLSLKKIESLMEGEINLYGNDASFD